MVLAAALVAAGTWNIVASTIISVAPPPLRTPSDPLGAIAGSPGAPDGIGGPNRPFTVKPLAFNNVRELRNPHHT